ncbi:MAG: putative photosynthetic complex assembly protein PuhE [Alphaproteobacteria bacterium]
MSEFGGPILFALFLWWSSTGAVLYLVGLPHRSFPWSMAGATGLAGLSLAGLVALADTATPWAAYLGFACGLGLWAWHETSFLFGFVTGPRRLAVSRDADGWRRFRDALGTLVYHELAILVTAVALAWLLWDAANQVGLWAFLLLWIMRLSAKLNIFLGVPNMNEEFLPAHLGFLRSYFRKRAMNVLFPISVTLGTLTFLWLLHRGVAYEGSGFQAAACLMLAAMLALAVLEHWFLVLPVPDAALWRWAMPAPREERDQATLCAGSTRKTAMAQRVLPPLAPSTGSLRKRPST